MRLIKDKHLTGVPWSGVRPEEKEPRMESEPEPNRVGYWVAAIAVALLLWTVVWLILSGL